MAAGAAAATLSIAGCGSSDTTQQVVGTDTGTSSDAADTGAKDGGSDGVVVDAADSGGGDSGGSDAADTGVDTNVAKPYGAPPADGLLVFV